MSTQKTPRRWLAAIVGILAVVALVLAAYVMLPGITSAPTHEPTPTPDQAQATIEDLISVSSPLPRATITSPVTISGEARGNWYFEASAPVMLKDAAGVVIAHGIITARGDWMTSEFVPFTGTLTFTAPATKTGTLVLQNDNPSGDPARQKELAIPVRF